jgi:hypothetical protein
MIVTSRSGAYRPPRSGGISGVLVLFIVFILAIAGAGYVAYQASLAPKASISITMDSECAGIAFHVTNQDNRVFKVWAVTLQVSPAGSGITYSPQSASVGELGPQGEYDGSFSLSFGGTPPGTYQFTANLVNESQNIASSNTLSCTVK